jgi:exopolysaccharide biosynthesis polyprenyl glycosylphosphotransferase
MATPPGLRNGPSDLAALPVGRSSVGRISAETAIAIVFAGDALVILAGLLLGFWLRFQSGWIPMLTSTEVRPDEYPLSRYIGLILVGSAFLLGTFIYLRLYRRRRMLHQREAGMVIVRGATFWVFAYLGASLFLKFDPPISRVYAFLSYISAVLGLLGWRWILSRLLRLEPFAASLRQRLLVVGWTSEAARIVEAVVRDRRQPYQVVGYVPTPTPTNLLLPVEARQVGDYSQLETILESGCADIVLLSDLDLPRDEIIALANLCERVNVQFKLVPNYFQILISGLQLETVSGIPILGVSRLPLDRLTYRTLKRCVDIVGSLVGLLIAAPIIAVCGILIRLESPGPIFFSQERIGRAGTRFRMLKLRSMRLGADGADHLNQSTQREDPRVLRIGEFMRRWNLDELPQFWNALVGDMALVGPRPERTYHVQQLTTRIPHYNARHAAKPGLTGWAQVNGLRGDTDLTERVRYDLWYLENWSLWLDFQIMFMTFVSRKNAY